MPFITEELYQHLRNQDSAESIVIAPYPETQESDEQIIKKFDFANQVIMAVRNFRQEKNISPKEKLQLLIKKNYEQKPDTTFDCTVEKMCNLEVGYVNSKPEDAFSIIIETTEFYIPVGQDIDLDSEISKLEADLEYQKNFLVSVEKKLSNHNFVSNAPETVVNMERKKQSDAIARIAVIESQLESLKG
jgi:valyl-tRNA synthetase